MRGLKSLAFILTLVGMALGVALMPATAKAGPIGLIQEIRAEIAWLEADWVHVDQILLDIDEEIAQVRGKLLHAMHMIDAGNSLLGTVIKQDLQAAIQEKEVIITVKFEELNDFLGFIDEGTGEIIGKIEAAVEEHKCHPKKCDKVKTQLLGMEKLVEFISLDAATMEALLEDGDEGEDLDDPETFDDVDDWLEFCLENQIADDFNDYIQCKESIGRALEILDDFVSIKASIYKKKKFAVKRLITAKKLMLSTAAPKVRKVSELGGASVQVYTLSGQLVLVDRTSGSLESLKNKLTNGVYLAVIGNRVERLVVLN
jgi:hypothetical protein